MAARTKAPWKADRYLELVHRFPLRPIRSDKELDHAIHVLDSLLDRTRLEPEEKDYLDVLSDQIERYEDTDVQVPGASDAEVLQHLIEAKGVTQAEVAKSAGISESTISEVLSGKRTLNRQHLGKLSRYFRVSAGVFTFCAYPTPESPAPPSRARPSAGSRGRCSGR